ncbi:MAG TPA: histidine phosphatase family protein [Gaiellaceae bacterium]|nr:histidine phosphatase family protein [Gaiellaceae bacterium]
MIEVVYETHSTTTDNEAGIATGWNHGQLSETGRRQAEALGERRRDDGVAAVFASDLRRAVETAEIAFAGSGIPVHEDWRLRECNYGDLNGTPVAEIDAERLRRIEDPFPGGESYGDVVERTRSFIEDLPAELEGARIVLIAHSANRWALQHLLEGRELAELIAEPFDWQEGWLYRLDRRQMAQG